MLYASFCFTLPIFHYDIRIDSIDILISISVFKFIFFKETLFPYYSSSYKFFQKYASI